VQPTTPLAPGQIPFTERSAAGPDRRLKIRRTTWQAANAKGSAVGQKIEKSVSESGYLWASTSLVLCLLIRSKLLWPFAIEFLDFSACDVEGVEWPLLK
jgi:hypothetical protein